MPELNLPDAPASSRLHAHELGRHRGYLLRVAQRQLRDATLSEDIVQDALLDGLRALGRFDGRSSVRTWLTTILQRRIADALRRLRRRRLHEADSRPGTDATAHEGPDVPEAGVDRRDPVRLLEARQALSRLDQGVQALSPLAARVLMLREVDGLSTAETAHQLGIEAARVSTILGRARDRLRRTLGQHKAKRVAALSADVN